MAIQSRNMAATHARGSQLRRQLFTCALSALAALASAGCGDDGDSPEEEEHAHGGGTEPAYAYIRENRGNFVNLAKSSDIPHDAPQLDPKKAREFEGDPWFAGGAAIDNDGFELQQLHVSDDLEWSEGHSLNFSEFPLGEDGVSWFFAWQLDDHHVYFNYDVTNRVVWDPTDFKILTSKEDSKIPQMFEGLPVEAAGNRSALKSDGQPVQMAYFWKDEDWWKFGSKSVVAIYDPKTHAETKLIEVGCPGLAVGTRDEDGYTYWGTWDYKGLVSLYEQGPKPCLARITPDGELDEEFTTDLLDLTGGKFGKAFMYVRDGWGLYLVFDHERTGLDFSQDPVMSDDIATNPIDYWWNPTYWKLYKVDLEAKTAEPFEPLEDVIVLEYGIERVDDRVFISITYAEEWDSEQTAGEQWEDVARLRVEELQPDDTTETFSMEGDERGRWARIR